MKRSTKDKLNDVVSLDKKSSMLEIAEGMISYNYIPWFYGIICTYRYFLEFRRKKCDIVPVERDSLNIVKSPLKSPGNVLEKRSSNLYEP